LIRINALKIDRRKQAAAAERDFAPAYVGSAILRHSRLAMQNH
jgi:hypothetical protein